MKDDKAYKIQVFGNKVEQVSLADSLKQKLVLKRPRHTYFYEDRIVEAMRKKVNLVGDKNLFFCFG